MTGEAVACERYRRRVYREKDMVLKGKDKGGQIPEYLFIQTYLRLQYDIAATSLLCLPSLC
jgi:hypothetical protein